MKNGRSYEFTGRTVEAAVDEGLRQLGLARDLVEVEVLQEGSRGILGIGATDAQVRLTRKTDADSVDEAQAEAPDLPADETERPEDGGQERPEAESSHPQSSDDAAPDEEGGEPAEEMDQGEGAPPRKDEDGDAELEDLAHELLGDMLERMGVEADVELSWLEGEENGDRPLNLNIVGEDLGFLIGRNGESLASIQYLIRLMVNQQLHSWKNIVVDVDGYKQRRAEQLDKLAHRLADQVVASGRPVSLEPMPANERRLVHIALRDHGQVYTSSTGEDNRRKVQILPK